MKIRSVSVDGLYNGFDYELKLNPDLTYIHSPNGYGKSTLMHMLYSALKGDSAYLEEIPFKRFDIEFVDGTVLIIENKDCKLTKMVQKMDLDTRVTDEDVESMSDITYLGPDRLTIRKKDGHLVNALEFCAQELYETIRRAKDDNSLTEYTGERREMSDSELDFWCKDLNAKLDFIKDAGFYPVLPTNIKFPPSRYEIIDNRKACEDLAYSISEYVDRDYQLAESIIVFKDIVNNIFLNKYIDVTESGKLTVTMANGTSLQLNKLSSGETQILLMFYNILFHSHQDGIVIVDEPEISLHVSWQQMIGDYFSDICRVRKIQMLVATHSPQVIHDRWDQAQELVLKNA